MPLVMATGTCVRGWNGRMFGAAELDLSATSARSSPGKGVSGGPRGRPAFPWAHWCPPNPNGLSKAGRGDLCSRHLLAVGTFTEPVTPSQVLIYRAVCGFGPIHVIVQAFQKQAWHGGGWRDPRRARKSPERFQFVCLCSLQSQAPAVCFHGQRTCQSEVSWGWGGRGVPGKMPC